MGSAAVQVQCNSRKSLCDVILATSMLVLDETAERSTLCEEMSTNRQVHRVVVRGRYSAVD